MESIILVSESDLHSFWTYLIKKYDKDGVAASSILSSFGVNYPANASNPAFLALDMPSLYSLAFPSQQSSGPLALANDNGTYFSLDARSFASVSSQETPLVYYYMSTPNNNFSNRDQKGKIVVIENQIDSRMIGSQGGTMAIG
jgi:hypothetical protein